MLILALEAANSVRIVSSNYSFFRALAHFVPKKDVPLLDWQLKYLVVPELVYVIWNQVSWPMIEGCTGWIVISSAFSWRRSTRLCIGREKRVICLLKLSFVYCFTGAAQVLSSTTNTILYVDYFVLGKPSPPSYIEEFTWKLKREYKHCNLSNFNSIV